MERQGVSSAEGEAEGRIKSLPYKVRAASKESQTQRAALILDSDLRTHWSTGTNAKEWILLELEESCLLSLIRIHNKSVMEWEISISLRSKPETFFKVRPRCEAPRRDIAYSIGFLPCRYVRIACLRGNPISIFYVQLMGISVPGLEPELQPVLDYFLPQIISRIKEPYDIQLQLLQDISIRLSPFLQQLEGELSVPAEAMDSTIRFLAMLVGPFYPFLSLFRAARDNDKLAALGGADEELGKNSLASVFTVSSNFQAPPKRIRSPGLSLQTSGQSLAWRSISVVILLKLAYKDVFLSNVCKKVARLLRKLSLLNAESTPASSEIPESSSDEHTAVNDTPVLRPADYSKIFGEDFRISDDESLDLVNASSLDVSAVEEALLHLLYACASQPLIVRRLAEAKSDLSPVLPFLRSLLPALRPPASTAVNADIVDETFWQWQAPLVQRAVNQVVALVTAPSYRPLLDACAGYLSAYSPAHEKSACVLIDLCAGPLAPWLTVIISKVDLAIELLEDLLGIIQAGQEAPTQARAALVYMVLALSGRMDNVLNSYKVLKHKVLFLIEMLEPYLIPAIIPVKSTIAFGDVSAVVLDKHEKTCALALELLHTALQKPSILRAMEAEWRREHVAPSVLLSILAPHVALPPGIDQLKCVQEKGIAAEGKPVDTRTVITFGTTDETSAPEIVSKVDVQQNEDALLLFAPLELKGLTLLSVSDESEISLIDDGAFLEMLGKLEGKTGKKLVFDIESDEHEWDLKGEYWQLVDSAEREQRASDFIRFASELHSRQKDSTESHQSAIDALLLAAECHVNPFFMISSKEHQKLVTRLEGELHTETEKAVPKELDLIAQLEEERDKAVLHILMRAAEWDTLGAVKGMSGYGDSSDDISCNIGIAEVDMKSEDAVTLVRQRQGLLCRFLMHQLQRDRHNLYEVLLQGLLYVLHSATQLSATPEDIIEVILGCATRLNVSLVAYSSQGSNGIISLGPSTFHSVRRQWVLLRKLVLVASGGGVLGDPSFSLSPQVSHLYQDLIPGSAWMSTISQFATSPHPLVRYIGWMGVAQCVQIHNDHGVPLISDLQDLTTLLLVFSDELISIELLKFREAGEINPVYKDALDASTDESKEADPGLLAKVLYPELSRVFPSLRVEFSRFGDTILQALCARIQLIPRLFVPDMLSWFSEICLQPFPARQEVKGFTLGNARYVIMRLLEAIIVEHVEAILPELSRVFQVVISLCSSSYCDVNLLEAVLSALKPIISHATLGVMDTAETSVETLSYETVMQQLGNAINKSKKRSKVRDALPLFLAGFLLSSVSYTRRNNILTALKSWVSSGNFSTSASGHLLDTLSALQKILDEILGLLKESAGEDCSVSDEKHRASENYDLHSLVGGANSPVLGTPESEALDSPSGGDTREETVGDERGVEDGGAVQVEILERGNDVEQTGRDNSQDSPVFRQKVHELILALGPGLEVAMKLHPQLTSTATVTAAQCLYYAGVTQIDQQLRTPSVKALALSILALQNVHCWQVSSTCMEYLLSLSSLSDVYQEVSSILENQCTRAPRVSWRLLPAHWLSKTFKVESLHTASDALIKLLNTMLDHPEPEQRAGVLRLVETLVEDGEGTLSSKSGAVDDQRSPLENFVSAMWIRILTTATSDASARLRKQASDVLIRMVPFVESTQLQSLLISFDMIFKSGPLTRSGLSLLAHACLYSNPPQYTIIPSRVWNSIESLAQSKPVGKFVEGERELCLALIRLRNEEENAKEHALEVLRSAQESASLQSSSHPVREAVLEVLARLSVQRSKAELATSAAIQRALEVEEAEIELELAREERVARSGDGAVPVYPSGLTNYMKDSSAESGKDRLKLLRAQIIAEEHAAARAEVAARREKQRIARRNRQLALEEATLREMTLLQELEKERAAEAERDIERQRLLEKERAKTRESKLSLDLDTERRSQREYQRELEQRETGVVRTSTRREFASNTTPSSRPRERYREREREGQRGSGQEAPVRTNSDSGARESATTPPATPTAAAAAAAPASSTPASSRNYGRENARDRDRDRERERDRDRDRDRDRSNEREEPAGDGLNGDGGDDPGAGGEGGGGSTGGASHRQGGPRSARPRQIVERRERDGRREGKWERKQT